MSHHLLLTRKLALDADTLGEAEVATAPRHSLALLARELGSSLHPPVDRAPGLADRLAARLLPDAAAWTQASALAERLGPDDRVYCGSEVPGYALAARLRPRPEGPRLTLFVHNVDRPRARAALRLWNLPRRVERFLACSQPQVDYLHASGVERDRAVFVWDHTDTRFFTPGPVSSTKQRPGLVSVGLEQRDYRTLAAASADLDLDVRISGFSRDTHVSERAFPPVLPANMTRQFYPWPDLRQLYRDADAVVVSLFPNPYAAGVQGLMEAMACARPVIVSTTVGLASYIHPEASIAVPPGDVDALRRAIRWVLDHPAEARAMGERGRELALQRHTMEQYVRTLAEFSR